MSDREQLLDREAVARETHQWVRLTKCCNNHCRFCLDAEAFDGSHLPRAEIEGQIASGADAGATRLILSGGEPTIHPDFIDFVLSRPNVHPYWLKMFERYVQYGEIPEGCPEQCLKEP